MVVVSCSTDLTVRVFSPDCGDMDIAVLSEHKDYVQRLAVPWIGHQIFSAGTWSRL